MQEVFIDSISTQIGETLEKMKKAKSIDDKVKYSEIIRNLSESMEHFSNTVASLAAFEQEFSDYDDFDDDEFFDDDEDENPFN